MPSESGGAAYFSATQATEGTHVPGGAWGGATSGVCRKKDFELVCDQPVESKVVVNAVLSLVQPPQLLDGVQQINNRKYIVSFKTVAGAETFLGLASKLNIPGTTLTCKWMGAEFKRVKVAFLPLAVPNEELASVLKKFGRVIQITEELHRFASVPLKTGTRFVDMEMDRPVPNMISVRGFTVPATYRGVIIQCRRCLQAGHMKSDCNVPYCGRCRAFGHNEDACSAPCLKCGSPDHHWRNCAVRNYAFATAAAEDGNPDTATIAGGSGFAADPQEGVESAVVDVEEQMNIVAKGPFEDDTASTGCQAEPPTVVLGSREPDVESTVADVSSEIPELTCKTPEASANDATCSRGNGRDVAAAERDSRALACAAGSSSATGAADLNPLAVNQKADEFAGEANNAMESSKDMSGQLEWKRALTRSKRKLLVTTPGISPLTKKSVIRKAAMD